MKKIFTQKELEIIKQFKRSTENDIYIKIKTTYLAHVKEKLGHWYFFTHTNQKSLRGYSYISPSIEKYVIYDPPKKNSFYDDLVNFLKNNKIQFEILKEKDIR